MEEPASGEGSIQAEAITGPLFEEGEELDLESVYDIPVEISVVLGKAAIPINKLLQIGTGEVLELERKVGDPVEVLVNGRLVAKGEVVIVEDHVGITMTEIIKQDKVG